MKALTHDDRALVARALKRASVKGFNPYDSHEAQADEYTAKWERRERYRAERDAKRRLPWRNI